MVGELGDSGSSGGEAAIGGSGDGGGVGSDAGDGNVGSTRGGGTASGAVCSCAPSPPCGGGDVSPGSAMSASGEAVTVGGSDASQLTM